MALGRGGCEARVGFVLQIGNEAVVDSCNVGMARLPIDGGHSSGGFEAYVHHPGCFGDGLVDNGCRFGVGGASFDFIGVEVVVDGVSTAVGPAVCTVIRCCFVGFGSVETELAECRWSMRTYSRCQV